jgi:hypothetical protein
MSREASTSGGGCMEKNALVMMGYGICLAYMAYLASLE